MQRPRIAITSGDPAGVGPELCLKLIANPAVQETCVPIVFGDATVFTQVAEKLNLQMPSVCHDMKSVSELDRHTLVDFAQVDAAEVQAGVVNATTGTASFAYIDRAIDAAMSGQVDAIVTGPIHKEAIHAAGVPYPGHTEMLADKTKADRHLMMLTSEMITCSLVTAHVGLEQVSSLLSVESILEAIELSHNAMQQIRVRNDVHLVVCGLNPHAGEGGLFGNREEEKFIVPAVNAARDKGINVTGPLPPDTAFMQTNRERTDCYVCMYHDQGLIPLKALAFDKAVNVTLGLPIVRTSVDHGTALDIAWQGIASESSFIEAVALAVKLAG